jgi:hypothetical protein
MVEDWRSLPDEPLYGERLIFRFHELFCSVVRPEQRGSKYDAEVLRVHEIYLAALCHATEQLKRDPVPA